MCPHTNIILPGRLKREKRKLESEGTAQPKARQKEKEI
jgi:hypothetical protein